MKQINCTTPGNTDNVASYYIDSEGDIFECSADSIEPITAEVVVDGFYVGSAEEMRKASLRKYLAATAA
jgi:hypothetical protein